MSGQIKIIHQVAMLTVETNTDPLKVRYSLRILLKDDAGNKHSFRSDKWYAHDESGKALFDLETVETANRKPS